MESYRIVKGRQEKGKKEMNEEKLVLTLTEIKRIKEYREQLF